MAAYRYGDASPVLFNLLATEAASNGTLQFYDIGTTDPRDTFSDRALTTPNPNPVELDSAGRPSVNVWMDGEYTVKAEDEDGNDIWTKDFYPPADEDSGLPDQSGNGGKVLTTDGATAAWEFRHQLPDPTGSAGYTVVANSDGDGFILQAPVEAEDPPTLDIAIASGSLIVGDGESDTKARWLAGTGSGTSAGGRTQSTSVTFSPAFSATPTFFAPVLTNTAGLSPDGNVPIPRITALSASGATIVWTMGELDDSQTDYDFNTGVTFMWAAFGLYEA